MIILIAITHGNHRAAKRQAVIYFIVHSISLKGGYGPGSSARNCGLADFDIVLTKICERRYGSGGRRTPINLQERRRIDDGMSENGIVLGHG
jgi:hypothetical protein